MGAPYRWCMLTHDLDQLPAGERFSISSWIVFYADWFRQQKVAQK
jgi:hypothetical protein